MRINDFLTEMEKELVEDIVNPGDLFVYDPRKPLEKQELVPPWMRRHAFLGKMGVVEAVRETEKGFVIKFIDHPFNKRIEKSEHSLKLGKEGEELNIPKQAWKHVIRPLRKTKT
jgi:hypothetical protein